MIVALHKDVAVAFDIALFVSCLVPGHLGILLLNLFFLIVILKLGLLVVCH